MAGTESERREFTRLSTRVTVRFKYLTSAVQHPDLALVHEGSCGNLSIGGMLLSGPIPQLDWVKELLLGRMFVGVNIQLPRHAEPIKVLARLAWIEALDDGVRMARLGLSFQDMNGEHRRLLSDFLVREAMP